MRSLHYTFKFLLILLIIITVFLGNGITEKIFINQDIETFKARGVFVAEYGDTSYYLVSKKYDYEDSSKEVLNLNDRNYPGAKGDILITNRNPLRESVIVGWISQIMWIGHCAIVSSDDGKNTIHIVGNQTASENIVKEVENKWIIWGHENDEIAIVRVKNINEEMIDKALNYARSKIGYPYNYSFIFNQSYSFYCSDLVSRSIEAAGVNINYDNLVTTGADILISKNTYLVYYREKKIIDNNPKYFVYFLGN
mgnify:CR=1 FL=1